MPAAAFDTPVTGGNVSFYNQNPDGPVYPTPTIGMVGLVEDLKKKMSLGFKNEGDLLYLVGTSRNDINCSEYLHQVVGAQYSPAPHFDLEEEYALQQTVAGLIQKGLIVSAHDLSEGGLFVALCEGGFVQDLGFAISSNKDLRADAFLFGEAQSRVLVSVRPEGASAFEAHLSGAAFEKLGAVTKSGIQVDGQFWGSISDWKGRYDTAIERKLAKSLESEGALGLI
jgi:phosphoribosylformylglycinamidine (FGAM) synthase-like enzyme